MAPGSPSTLSCRYPRPTQVKRANFGLPSDRARRWCGTCASAHEGAIDVVNKRCEDCQKKRPNFGMPSEKKARWCHGCSQKHEGSTNVVSKRCEDCKTRQPSYGMPPQDVLSDASSVNLSWGKTTTGPGEVVQRRVARGGKQRWCKPCAIENHPGSIKISGQKRMKRDPRCLSPKTPENAGTRSDTTQTPTAAATNSEPLPSLAPTSSSSSSSAVDESGAVPPAKEAAKSAPSSLAATPAPQSSSEQTAAAAVAAGVVRSAPCTGDKRPADIAAAPMESFHGAKKARPLLNHNDHVHAPPQLPPKMPTTTTACQIPSTKQQEEATPSSTLPAAATYADLMLSMADAIEGVTVTLLSVDT